MLNTTRHYAAMAFLCAAPVMMASCTRSVQDNLNDEVAILSKTLDTLMNTTEENADDMLAELGKLEQKLNAMYEERKGLDQDEVKKAYLSPEHRAQLTALSQRLDDICPAFSMRIAQAADSGKMSAVFDKARSICRGLVGAG